MKKALVKIHNIRAGILTENSETQYMFQYDVDYDGEPISLALPIRDIPYKFNAFPPFFDGLLPEGIQLDGLLKVNKIDKTDYFSQLLAAGADLVGAVTIEEMDIDDE
ncbi:MAG: HipA N-terminal domain-containing protein [Candidatus Marinimicrobia bacterium]|jgi:serine/threonine-protein kinase HipA|nr:HipA N-terminal domain-containing protein [Candidatus Neomarinimicrobiota bacterium]